MNENDINNQLELFPEVKLFNILLNNIFQAAPYLESIQIIGFGTKSAPDYNAKSPEFDTKYIPSLTLKLNATNIESISFIEQQQIKALLNTQYAFSHFIHNTEDLLKEHYDLVYKLIEIALVESKILSITHNNSRDSSYDINPIYNDLILNQLWTNPILSEKNQFSDNFNQTLSELLTKAIPKGIR